MSGNRGGGEGDFLKTVVFLRPERCTIGFVQGVDAAVEFLAKIVLESGAAAGTPAEVTAFVADFVVYLPGGNLALVLIMPGLGADDLAGILHGGRRRSGAGRSRIGRGCPGAFGQARRGWRLWGCPS